MGCAILPKEGFSDQELIACSERIDPSTDSNLSYYPLLRPGERFPVNDPLKQPNLIPRPEDRALYLHGILEAIARVEKQGLDALEELGATPITEVWDDLFRERQIVSSSPYHTYVCISIFG